ncbi:pathogenesis-related protein 1-like protein [Rhodotorula toruloides]|uniref:Pathogenesis-related protein 1-like protein n=1 Tax=Rhodotorula toruloides TaxID=5286 RepID=A0A511KHZ4_RHOTO|nr:pathogenesis-related protein 1-like protein [Rhodotorula toruloides]
MSPRRPPPQPIRISRRQGRTEASTNHAAIPTTNHAAIPTFTRRLPKEGPQAATNMFSGSSPASPVDSLTAHAAHGSPAQYRSRPPSGKILVAVAVDVQPPTPEVIEPSSRRRSAEAAAALRALKKCRRTASVYSSSSSNGTLEIAATQVGRQGGVYLRPDLSGKSNLTFDQLPRTVSLEDLVVREPGNEEETLASSTIAAENVDQRSEPLIRATPPSNLPIRSSYLSRSSSLVPLTGQHIPPPRYQSRSTPPSRPSHPSPLSARSRRNETEAERFKRLYLCPWEGDKVPVGAPKAAGA